MTQRTTPPFRADHVGSLLRPAALKEARAKHAKGEINAAALREVEDREIEKIIKKQEEIGLKLATDGEFRRSWWHFDFFKGLDGVELYHDRPGHQVRRRRDQGRGDARSIGKIGFSGHPHIEHFKFLKAHTKVDAEDDHPGAERRCISARAARSISKAGLSRPRRVLRRPRRGLPKAIRAFYDAGCRYLQLDDTAWAMMCDPKRARAFARSAATIRTRCRRATRS